MPFAAGFPPAAASRRQTATVPAAAPIRISTPTGAALPRPFPVG